MWDEGWIKPMHQGLSQLVGQARDYLRNRAKGDTLAHRPLGITLIALLSFLVASVAVLFLLLFVFTLIQGPEAVSPYPADPWGVSNTLHLTQLFDTAFLAIVELALGLAVGVGLWGMKAWVYPIAVGVYWLALLVNVNNSWNSPLMGRDLITILVIVAVLVYLHQPMVRDLFREEPSNLATESHAEGQTEYEVRAGAVVPQVGRIRRVKSDWSR